jgi:hypothetical protein
MSERHEVRREISKIDNIFHQKRVLDQVARETNFTYVIPNKLKFLGVKKYVKNVSNRINAQRIWENTLNPIII